MKSINDITEGEYYVGKYNGQRFIFMCIGGASSISDEKQFVISGSTRIFKLSEVTIIRENGIDDD